MKTLNLDEFVADTRTIMLKGIDYVVEDMSVEDFIAASADAKALEVSGVERGVAENVEGTIKHLHRAIPTLPLETLRALKVPQLVVLTQFVNGTLTDEIVKGTQAAVKGEPAGN